MSDDPRVQRLELLAWVGEDELGSGQVGIKQGLVPAGMVPLVAIAEDHDKIGEGYIRDALQNQANHYGKVIRLCRFRFVSEEIVIKPK